MAFSPENDTEIRNRIAGTCLGLKWTLLKSRGSQVVCGAPSSETARVYFFQPRTFEDFALGNIVTVQKQVEFNITRSKGAPVVTAAVFRVAPELVGGQIQRTVIENDGLFNGLMDVLALAGGTFSPGTELGNLPWFGFEVEHFIKVKVGDKNKLGMRIGDVTVDGPAAAAGLKTGDVVTSVNGRVFGSSESLGGILRDIKPGEPFTLDVVRDGQTVTLNGVSKDQPEVAAIY